eukprot:COSAG02_NODE_6971_length_3258_cov_2.134853_2_plen_92_part_00
MRLVVLNENAFKATFALDSGAISARAQPHKQHLLGTIRFTLCHCMLMIVTIDGQPLAAAQAKGLERGTSAYPLSSLGTQGVVEMAHRLLTR